MLVAPQSTLVPDKFLIDKLRLTYARDAHRSCLVHYANVSDFGRWAMGIERLMLGLYKEWPVIYTGMEIHSLMASIYIYSPDP